MVDRIAKETRSRVMSRIRSENTRPELALRRALWAKGFRFRIHHSREKIDIAFPGKKVAVFVDGCFWHGCPVHFRPPKSHEEYWHPKLRKNIERDREKNKRLENDGWEVLRFWEHELEQMDEVLTKIRHSLNDRTIETSRNHRGKGTGAA